MAVCLGTVLGRTTLRATKRDPDLRVKRQRWTAVSQFLFLAAYVASVYGVTFYHRGPVQLVIGWLLMSANDANLLPARVYIDNQYCSGMEFTAIQPSFETFVMSATAICAFFIFLPAAITLGTFLTSLCWRIARPLSLQSIIESFLEVLRLPTRSLELKEAHPFWINAGRTLLWIMVCYASLFWLFGLSGEPLGFFVQSWMLASIADAGFVYSRNQIAVAPDWAFHPNMRIFLASIVALYGTAPLAVTATVFLPYVKPRRIVLNSDGICFPNGPLFPMWFRPFRLWSDVKSIALIKNGKVSKDKAKFLLRFHGGGAVQFDASQISAQDLKVLINAADENGVSCSVAPEVFMLCQELEQADPENMASDGVNHTGIKCISAQAFKSTVFVPFNVGECFPDTNIRVVKQLLTKPLCAVYLARTREGQLAVVKQFYLADDSDQTRALAKVFQREFELLTSLDHPGLSKVLSSFLSGSSTYLMLEHRPGTDLRSLVTEHGARSESRTVSWAKQLCEIMIYLHEREPAILHRDLTPDNIIAADDRQLRLIDFGAAREFLEGITGTMIGKQNYMAPEQVRGETNQRSDIYSFGGTLNYLLTGRDPVALSQSSPANNSDCSEELDALIRDCTNFDEEKRPQTFREVLERINEFDRPLTVKLNLKTPEAVR